MCLTLLVIGINIFCIPNNYLLFSGGGEGGGGTGEGGGGGSTGGGGGGGGSDSDDTSENSTAGGCTPLTSTETVLSSRSPRPSKYNFYVELGKNTYIRNACLYNVLFLESIFVYAVLIFIIISLCIMLLVLMKKCAFLRCLSRHSPWLVFNTGVFGIVSELIPLRFSATLYNFFFFNKICHFSM